MTILDQYTASGPDLQNTLDLFKGEWSSQLPDCYGVQAGAARLFEDARIHWVADQFGGFQGKTVLELGPLEAGHTYMMEQLGAASITAVEANSRSFLKCLLVKELLDLKRSHFVYSDCIEFLKSNSSHFDICIASGILYHMVNPVELIALASQVSQQLFIWTHYYDSEIVASQPQLAVKFPSCETREYSGFHHTLHRYEYQAALGWSGFCGGSSQYSHWMSRDDILACCRHFGFGDIRVEFENREHPNGPCFAFAALKESLPPQTNLTQTELERSNDRNPDRNLALRSEIDRLQTCITNLQIQNQRLEQDIQTIYSQLAAIKDSCKCI